MRPYLQIISLVAIVVLGVAPSHAKNLAPGIEIPEYDVLALDDNIRSLLDREIKPLPTRQLKLARLHELLYHKDRLNIRYSPSGTRTAVDTFYTGKGNCMSLANLFIATARYVGLKARFQSVRVAREWRPRDGYYEVPGHINVVVLLPRSRATIEFNQTVYEELGKRKVVKKVVSDKQAKAEFLNNLGVEMLAKPETLPLAIAYFEAAIDTYKKLDFTWSNLGVAYKKAGNLKAAEHAYRKALDINPYNQSTVNNIYILYTELGDDINKEKYAIKAEKYARKNPYYLEQLANAHINEKQYGQAIKLLKSAVKILDTEPGFYHALAVAYYFKSDVTRSRKALERAKNLAESEEYKLKYQRKIDSLASSSQQQ